MATLALSLAGQVVGGMIGGPIGATIGRALGALAGSSIDSAIFGERSQPHQGSDIRIGGSTEGVPIPRLYGWSRLSGNIMWATDLERLNDENAGSKGTGGNADGETIAASFALALCEGQVAHLGRIWADGKLLETEGLTIRFYRGTANQQPDSFMVARQGAGEVPGYRGLCYIVFERLPLTQFGNRIPNISVELCRPVGDLEKDLRAVCIIPGSTEYGYDPAPRVKVLGQGRYASENNHVSAMRSDWDISLDELTALCPNLEHVGLVVSWFGTDLRCGQCTIEPRVEAKDRVIRGADWAVAGYTRETANAVSNHDDGPAYGGTPADTSVRAAIADLKARGIKVTLYPFVMMDIAASNDLTDPYSLSGGQPAYPWRGRITCHPAPGVAGAPDGSGAAAMQVNAFLASGYREMILHYARLAKDAGGVDAILIGSEMRGLTQVRSSATTFPFVDGLRALAADARAIVGPATKITYAADWSEYFGYQPPNTSGDMIFHLDPLWADANIDAVGIDNYMPLADWRDGKAHADIQRARSIYDADYLAANIAGGEGYDWYYASTASRNAGIRTPIADAAHGEPWIWRYKDLENWWGRRHYNRIGGVRSGSPTAWVPESKPIWLTELGCGAVDKGPNAPNAFGDPKSGEDAHPPFSSGLPDPLVQRQMLRASLAYWKANGGAMLDFARIYIWCWDARPFPAFPALTDIWADGDNYHTGHWLNGRLGLAAADEMIAAIADDYGIAIDHVDVAPPLVQGLTIETVAAMRDVTATLAEACGLVVRDGPQGLCWVVPDDRAPLAFAADDLVRKDGPVLARRRGDPAETIGRLTLSFIDRLRDYQMGAVLATTEGSDRLALEHTGLVLDTATAGLAAQSKLSRLAHGNEGIDFHLPPSQLAVEPTDIIIITIAGEAGFPFVVGEIRDGESRTISARVHGEMSSRVTVSRPRVNKQAIPTPSVEPIFAIAHLPAGDGKTALAIGAFAHPWPGKVDIRDMTTGTGVATLERSANLGALDAALPAGQAGIWVNDHPMLVRLLSGHLSAATPEAVLAGGNRIAVQSVDGAWEIVGFAEAQLIGAGLYRLQGLLRGLLGTHPAPAASGASVLVLNSRTAHLDIPRDNLGASRALRAYAGALDVEGVPLDITLDAAPALPLSPVHLSAHRIENGDIRLRWLRRARSSGYGWGYGDMPLDFAPERYRVAIFEGGVERRSFTTSAPEFVYTAAQQSADFGHLAVNFTFTVAQISADLGPGHVATGVFP